MAELGTPEWHRDRLLVALENRRKKVVEAENWYDGRHPIPNPPPGTVASIDDEAHAAFNAMQQRAIMNFIPPVVNQPARKCLISGIRFGESSPSSDPVIWKIWQRNQMDADHALSNLEALKVGSAPVLVWFDEKDHAKSTITVEDPGQTVVSYQAGSRRIRTAALKRWVDDSGLTFITLYLPGQIYKWQSTASADSKLQLPDDADAWRVRQPANEAWPTPNPLGVVPIVEVRANQGLKARKFGGGTPEFMQVITPQLRINQTVMTMLITEANQAFRQRWATNWDYPTEDDGVTPDKARMIRASASGLWALNSGEEDKEVRVGEFSQSDSRPFIDSIGMGVKHVASLTDTPPYAFLIGDMVNVAADTLARIEAGFTTKVLSHTNQFGEAWEEICRLALLVEGDSRATDSGLSVDWIQPESRTATEQSTLARTRFDLGAPQEAVFSALPDVDQQEAHRWVMQQAAESLLTDRSTTDATPAAEPTQRNKDVARV